MANLFDTEYTPIEGVHILSDSSYRKHVRKLPVLTCETCKKRNGEKGVEVKRCQGCWSVGFCSKECQRSLWPIHKENCRTLQSVLDLEELARHFYSEPFLLHYLRVALILKLGLLSPSYLPPADRFPSIIVHLHMHPTSQEHEMGIYSGKIDALGKEKIPGHLTVGISNEPEHAMMVRSFKEARKEADAHGRSTNPIVMVDFGYNRELINVGIEITPDAFDTARGNPPPHAVIPAPLPPLSFPLDVHAVLGLAGKYIKLDQDDKLKLCRDLRTIDKVFMYRKAQYLVHGKGPSFDAESTVKQESGDLGGMLEPRNPEEEKRQPKALQTLSRQFRHL
ncbi:SET domain and MYND-type zinc finger protein 6 [Psilocybe cubensis]|uniref:SET domain and MYND-type zinc finger protein 6 n=2 Tax=Psilocybe cubensis TaxID=181762 RepID=A0ACB8H1I1_PSICU|nr:SET domain and MYND-type zinc finger protein 6 [Psilocybe cubensis]KAH9481055.1 SET domain and MYND-type zinc finger protein 6 [Psilocybe cubensis]